SLTALGPRHSTTLIIESTFSWTLRWRGRSEDALKHAETAATGLPEVSGRDDIDSMFASYNYAACLQQADRADEAAAELKLLHDTRMRVLGPSHVDTMFT